MAVRMDWLHPLFWAALVAAGLLLMWLFRRYQMRWLPAWFSRLFLVALSLVAAFQPESLVVEEPQTGVSVLLLDHSDSVGPDVLAAAREGADAWLAGGENRLVIPFAAEAVLYDPEKPWPGMDGRASALVSALGLAESLLTDPARSQVLIASDGLVTELPTVAKALTDLHQAGVAIRLLPLEPRPAAGDLALGPILSPQAIWAGTTLDVILPVSGDGGFSAAEVTFYSNGETLQPVGQGQNALIYRLPRQEVGITTLSAEISPEGDPFGGNNFSHAALWVFPPPRTLFVSSDLGGAIRFTQSLRDYGLNILTASPRTLDSSPAALGQYQLIFLHNLQAVDLTAEQMRALRDYVGSGRGGLVFLGGDQTYSLGGFENSLLEPMLPVSLSPPGRSERSPMLILLMMDRSGSMGVVTAQGDLPIDLAKESAMRVIETLSGSDYLGLATYSLDTIWHVPVRELGEGLSRREALDAVSEIAVGTTTNMFSAMEELLETLQNLPPDTPQQRYLLLLSDGKSTDGTYPEFISLAEAIAGENVVISTIALGDSADEALMQAIAEAGKGRYYLVADVSRLPEVVFAESQAAQGLRVQYGQTTLDLEAPGHPILSGMSPAALPSLTAYNSLSSKEALGAEDILVTASYGDPILSSWQVGLGRVTAWMGDAGEAWVEPWPDPQDAARFWSQVIRYTLPNPALDAVQAAVSSDALSLLVSVKVPATPTSPGTRYQVRFSYAAPDGEIRTFQVPQVNPDTFNLTLPRPPEGAYRGVVTYQIAGTDPVELPAPFAINPSPEWSPPDQAAGLAAFADWRALTGGELTDFTTLLAADAEAAAPAPSALSPRGWMILAVLALWPVDIALRRRFHPWH